LAAPDSQLVLPATALAEAVWIIDRGKTSIPSSTDLLAAILTDSRISIYPLDQEDENPQQFSFTVLHKTHKT
jgi:hypothetical protein